MKIELQQFGGIIPGTDPVNLPANAAQVAQDVDLSEGTIRPWAITNAFRQVDFTGEVSAADAASPAAASKVTLASVGYLVSNYAALFTSISAKSFVYDRTSDTSTEPTSPITINSVSKTSTGFILHCDMTTDSFKPMLRGDTYEVVGPMYQFVTADQFLKGTDFTLPTTLLPGGTQAPSFSIPLYSEANGRAAYQIGTLQLVDVNGPNYSGSFTYPGDEGSVTRQTLGGKVDFHFDCNFIRNTPQTFYYIQQNVGTGATLGRDGPESPVSDPITIEPGKYVTLNVTSGANLYRSTASQSGFGLIEEGVSGSTFIDDLLDAPFAELPPNGAIGSIPTAGSLIHPAGFALYIDGADLRPSSEWIDVPRYWAVPEEYTYTFDSIIQCIALSGGTILVFTQTSVYRVHGQHPSRLTVYKVSDKPISNKATLWKDDVDVGWCNEEGLVIYDGRSGSLLTGPYMRADKWQELADTPADLEAKVNDKTVCLTGGGTDMRFDFRGDRSAALSTFTVSDGSVAAVWRSKVFIMPKPVSWYACRIEGSITGAQEIRFTLYADGVAVVSDWSATPGNEFLLPRTVKAWRWEIAVETDGEVRSIALATNRREL